MQWIDFAFNEAHYAHIFEIWNWKLLNKQTHNIHHKNEPECETKSR